MQQDLGGHQASSNKTLVATKPNPTRPWWPPSQVQQDLGNHKTCSKKTMAAKDFLGY